jgi:uncharacterized protein YdeI (BOF family)
MKLKRRISMYKILAVAAVSALISTSAFAAGGMNSPIGGQSENAQTSHTNGDTGADYTKLHHKQADRQKSSN